MSAGALLEALGLSVQAGGRTLVHPTHLALRPGQWKALVGPNGAGKTTLLKALATLVPYTGTVRYRGCDVREKPLAYRRALGVVLHEPLLYGELTALENLVFYARLYGLAAPRAAAREKLAAVGLEAYAHEPVSRFSRGMIQRLALARALLHRPELLLLDEPLSGIDARGEGLILNLFREAKERGIAALWVTHRWRRAWDVVDEVVEMQRGTLLGAVPTAGRRPEEWTPSFAEEARG